MFKEAIHKMPRQFAPQSLYNMMGKSLETCFSVADVDGGENPYKMDYWYSCGETSCV